MKKLILLSVWVFLFFFVVRSAIAADVILEQDIDLNCDQADQACLCVQDKCIAQAPGFKSDIASTVNVFQYQCLAPENDFNTYIKNHPDQAYEVLLHGFNDSSDQLCQDGMQDVAYRQVGIKCSAICNGNLTKDRADLVSAAAQKLALKLIESNSIIIDSISGSPTPIIVNSKIPTPTPQDYDFDKFKNSLNKVYCGQDGAACCIGEIVFDGQKAAPIPETGGFFNGIVSFFSDIASSLFGPVQIFSKNFFSNASGFDFCPNDDTSYAIWKDDGEPLLINRDDANTPDMIKLRKIDAKIRAIRSSKPSEKDWEQLKTVEGVNNLSCSCEDNFFDAKLVHNTPQNKLEPASVNIGEGQVAGLTDAEAEKECSPVKGYKLHDLCMLCAKSLPLTGSKHDQMTTCMGRDYDYMLTARAVCDPLESVKPEEYSSCVKCVAEDAGVWTAIGCVYTDTSRTISEVVFGFGIGLAGLVALGCILYASFILQTSSNNPERIKQAQDWITSCITGLIMIILSVFILRVIGVDILRIPGFEASSSLAASGSGTPAPATPTVVIPTSVPIPTATPDWSAAKFPTAIPPTATPVPIDTPTPTDTLTPSPTLGAPFATATPAVIPTPTPAIPVLAANYNCTTAAPGDYEAFLYDELEGAGKCLRVAFIPGSTKIPNLKAIVNNSTTGVFGNLFGECRSSFNDCIASVKTGSKVSVILYRGTGYNGVIPIGLNGNLSKADVDTVKSLEIVIK